MNWFGHKDKDVDKDVDKTAEEPATPQTTAQEAATPQATALPQTAAAGAAAPSPFPTVNPAAVEPEIIDALKTVYDPEIPVNIYDLGLIYELKVAPDGMARVKLTLTAPGCPVAPQIVDQVISAVRGVNGVRDAQVELTWEPPWTPDRMTEAARLSLGF